jgi:hypothetical protein
MRVFPRNFEFLPNLASDWNFNLQMTCTHIGLSRYNDDDRENGDEDVHDDFSGEKDVDGDTVDKKDVNGDAVDEEGVYEEGVDDDSFHEVDEDISDEYPEEEIVNPEEELRRELNSHIGTFKRTEELHKLGHKRYNLIQDCTWKSTDCRTG